MNRRAPFFFNLFQREWHGLIQLVGATARMENHDAIVREMGLVRERLSSAGRVESSRSHAVFSPLNLRPD